MPRARNLKPSLFKNELLGEADPLLTLLFEGLWTLADREGRLEDRPKRIKAEIFPYRELPDFNGYLTELERMGFICRYVVAGEGYIEVINFTKHQSPHKTEKASELPKNPGKSGGCDVTENAPLNNESYTVKESLTPDSLLLTPDSSVNESPTVPVAQAKPEKPKPTKRKSKLPDDFALTTERRDAALSYWRERNRLDLNVDDEFERFLAHHRANGKTMADWDAAWKTWYCNAVKFNKPQFTPAQAPHSGRQAVRTALRNIADTNY